LFKGFGENKAAIFVPGKQCPRGEKFTDLKFISGVKKTGKNHKLLI